MNLISTGPTIKHYQKELGKYTTGKDTIQFPDDKPLPEDLIRKIAE